MESALVVKQKHYFDRQELIEMVEDNDLEICCPVLRKRVSVLTLLHGIYPGPEAERLDHNKVGIFALPPKDRPETTPVCHPATQPDLAWSGRTD